MTGAASRPILMVGDSWLEKIHDLLAHLYPGVAFRFRGENAEEAEDAIEPTLIVATHGASLPQAPAVQVPRIWIDGLSSLEFAARDGGRVLLGREPLDDIIDALGLPRALSFAMQGRVDFHCLARFEQSLAALQVQEAGTLPVSDLITANFRAQRVLSGVNRPDPIITVPMARRLAHALGLPAAPFDAISHYAVGLTAFQPAKYCTLPFDATRLGLDYDPDPYWFPSFAGMFDHVKSTHVPPEDGSARALAALDLRQGLLAPKFPEWAAFEVAVAAGDDAEIVRTARALTGYRDRIGLEFRRKLDLALLRSGMALGDPAEAIAEACDIQRAAPDLKVVGVLANAALSKARLDQIDAIHALAAAAGLSQLRLDKLTRRRERLQAQHPDFPEWAAFLAAVESGDDSAILTAARNAAAQRAALAPDLRRKRDLACLNAGLRLGDPTLAITDAIAAQTEIADFKTIGTLLNVTLSKGTVDQLDAVAKLAAAHGIPQYRIDKIAARRAFLADRAKRRSQATER